MELPKFLRIAIAIVGFIIIGNLVLLDYLFVSQRSELLDYQTRLAQFSGSFQTLSSRVTGAAPVPEAKTVPVAAKPSEAVDTCSKSCLTAIDTAVKAANYSRPAVTTTTTTTLPRGEYFIPLGSGSVLNTEASSANWKTIDGVQATFDIANYGTIKAAYFEATLRVAGSGEAHARLFDSTTPAVFFNSDVYASTSTAPFISSPISISGPGSKTYKVQMYSTLSTGYLDQARIRIVTQ